MTVTAEDLKTLHDNLLTDLVRAATKYSAFAAVSLADVDPDAYAKLKLALETGQGESLCSVFVLKESPQVELSLLVGDQRIAWWQGSGHKTSAAPTLN